jgi:hypothetical protein
MLWGTVGLRQGLLDHMPHDHWRSFPLAAAAFSFTGQDGPKEPSVGDFQSVLLQHTRLQVKLKEVLWLSEFAVNERQVGGVGVAWVWMRAPIRVAGEGPIIAGVHSSRSGGGVSHSSQSARDWQFLFIAAFHQYVVGRRWWGRVVA